MFMCVTKLLRGSARLGVLQRARAGTEGGTGVTADKDCSHPCCRRDNCSTGRLHPTEHQSQWVPVQTLAQGT